MRSYVTNIAVSYSILVNATLGGMRYEMLSSRAYRCNWTVVGYGINYWFNLAFSEQEHCRLCYQTQLAEGIYDLA